MRLLTATFHIVDELILRKVTKRLMLYTIFIMPTLIAVCAKPMTLKYSPPCSFVIETNTCSTRTRIVDFRLFDFLSRSDNGLFLYLPFLKP